ncbi:unnamed protein product [Schistosoma margrebowiei]|uniref:Uncharacterized protein n=1 Tax=Schistosoma margrebowiei TaxID=48269 RepID=A0A183LVK3_9TREM|nr:unnamed protein product [Schistosoma margrebowiei]
MCWNNAGPIEVSNSLQSNDDIDDPTSKLTQFIYGALKSPTIRLLPLLHQDLSLLRRKSSATHSGLRYTTTTSLSCRRHFNLHFISSHVPETCANVSANLMVRTTRKTALQRFNTAFLRHIDKLLNQFKTTLNNTFQALQDQLKEEETTMEENCKRIKEALASTCQKVLSRKKHHHMECIPIETLHKIQEKNYKIAINNNREDKGRS